MIEIGDHVTISSNVSFVTHDNSAKYLFNDRGDLFGKIIIRNNCFIGQNATLMYGVELADNIIVAAGSVVTKSFHESNIIIGGNPAKVIGTWDDFRKKYETKAIRRKDLGKYIEDDSFFVRR